MPYYTGKVLPTPQEVVYHDELFPLSRTAIIVGKDVRVPAPLVSILSDRVRRYGGTAQVTGEPAGNYSTFVLLGKTKLWPRLKGIPKVPRRKQAYIMACISTERGRFVVLKARDRLGILWAVSSFIQLVGRGADGPFVRAASIRDFPVALNRGYLHGNVGAFNEKFTARHSMLFNIAFKFNKPVYKHISFNYNRLKMLFRSRKSKRLWRDTSLQSEDSRKNIRDIGLLLTPLGIQWYGGLHPALGPPESKLSGSSEDINALLYYATQVARAGGNFYIQLDDFRFPLNPYDKKHFKTAARADSFILRGLARRLKRDFPETRILVCPPFYWGPASPAPKWYGEPRDAYLYAMGRLPRSIQFQWTGPKVRSNIVKKEHVRWITAGIKRKPVYWQNAWASPHPDFMHYATDPVACWKAWYYPGFARDIDCHTYNGTIPRALVLLATIADYFWNPSAYNPKTSVTEAAKKLTGPSCYDALVELNKRLSFFL